MQWILLPQNVSLLANEPKAVLQGRAALSVVGRRGLVAGKGTVAEV